MSTKSDEAESERNDPSGLAILETPISLFACGSDLTLRTTPDGFAELAAVISQARSREPGSTLSFEYTSTDSIPPDASLTLEVVESLEGLDEIGITRTYRLLSLVGALSGIWFVVLPIIGAISIVYFLLEWLS